MLRLAPTSAGGESRSLRSAADAGSVARAAERSAVSSAVAADAGATALIVPVRPASLNA